MEIIPKKPKEIALLEFILVFLTIPMLISAFHIGTFALILTFLEISLLIIIGVGLIYRKKIFRRLAIIFAWIYLIFGSYQILNIIYLAIRYDGRLALFGPVIIVILNLTILLSLHKKEVKKMFT